MIIKTQKVFDTEEAVNYTGVSTNTLLRYAKNGLIKSFVKTENGQFWTLEELNKLMPLNKFKGNNFIESKDEKKMLFCEHCGYSTNFWLQSGDSVRLDNLGYPIREKPSKIAFALDYSIEQGNKLVLHCYCCRKEVSLAEAVL